MKKQTKKELKAMGWSDMTGTDGQGYKVQITGTSDLHKVRQSINQKTERSEEDVKERINHIVAPLAILIIVDILISFAILVR